MGAQGCAQFIHVQIADGVADQSLQSALSENVFGIEIAEQPFGTFAKHILQTSVFAPKQFLDNIRIVVALSLRIAAQVDARLDHGMNCRRDGCFAIPKGNDNAVHDGRGIKFQLHAFNT